MIRKAIATSVAILLSTTVLADDRYPKFTAEFSVELESDWTFSADDPNAEIIDTYTTTEAVFGVEFATGTILNAHFTLEPVLDPVDDRFFDDHGLYIEEIFLAQKIADATLILGKFDPAFGRAWDDAPGIYGTTFAEDYYQLTEKLGGQITVPFEAFGTGHEFTASAFMADTTPMSNSIFQDRGRTTTADGGVSNTSGPQSFAFTLSGTIGDTTYNTGIEYLRRGEGDTHSQIGFVAGATHSIAIDDATSVGLLGEVAYFTHYDGAEASAFVGTFGVAVPVGRFEFSAVYSILDVEGVPTDHLGTVSVGYEIIDSMVFSVAYAATRAAGETAHTAGIQLAYEFGFETE